MTEDSIPSELPDSMTWSMNQGSSIDITSEALNIHLTADDEDLYSEGFSESPLEKLRSILKSTHGNISECEEVIKEIASFDEDLTNKCETFAVINLLPQNSSYAVAGDFTVIISGVGILVKYGINLLKPKKNPNWRSIKLSNGAFKTKVQPLKGYEDILGELGYTERNTSSFDFLPSLQHPDTDKVAVVTADLLILQKELHQFHTQTHVNKDRFLKCFSTYQVGGLPGQLSSAEVQGITLERLPSQQDDSPREGEVNKENLQVKTPVPAPRRNIPQATSPSSQNASEAKPTSQPQPVERVTQRGSALPTGQLEDNDDIEVVPSVGPIKFPPSIQVPFAKPQPFEAWQDHPSNMSVEGQVAGLKATPNVPPRVPQCKPIKPGTNGSGLRTPADFTLNPDEGNARSGKEQPEVTIHKPPVVDHSTKPQAGFPLTQQKHQMSSGIVSPHQKVPTPAARYGSSTVAAPSLPPKPGRNPGPGSGTPVMNPETIHTLVGKSVGPPANNYTPQTVQPQIRLPPGAQPTPFAGVSFPSKSSVPSEPQSPQLSGHVNSGTPKKQEPPSGMKQQGLRETPPSASRGQAAKKVVSHPKVPLEDCAMCEGKPGIIHCDKCQSARCEACDRRWHSHPKRKAHQTRRLVTEEPVEEEEEVKMEVEEKKEECFVCGEIANFHCITCPNYFCTGCEETFHRQKERQSHERFKVGGTSDSQEDTFKMQDPLVTGAKPKMFSPVKEKAEPKKKPVIPQPSREEILNSRHEELVMKDVEVLERIDEVSQSCKDTFNRALEVELMQEEKYLRKQHLKLMDQITEIEEELSRMRNEMGGDIQSRGAGNRVGNVYQPPEPPMAPTREDRLHSNQEGQLRDEMRQNSCQKPKMSVTMKRKWVCGHCTFMNENLDDRVCGVCSKTTPDPEIVEEWEEEIECKDESGVNQRGAPREEEMYLQNQMEQVSSQVPADEYQHENDPQKQKEQENLSFRLLLFYRQAQEDGYSIEDVKTAWDIMEREGGELSEGDELPMTPVEWLDHHLHAQLEIIAGDIAKEFGRTYNMKTTGQMPDVVSMDEIHEAWWRNDGSRDNTAAECLQELYEKVEVLHASYQHLEKINVANALMKNDFNLNYARWYLEEQSSQEDARKVQQWIEKMWESTTSTTTAIEEIEKSQLNGKEKDEKIRRMLMAEHNIVWAAVDTVFSLREQEHHLSDCIEAVKAVGGNLWQALDYFKECNLCYTDFGMHKLVTLPTCQCRVCTECFEQQFTLLAKTTTCMYKFSCPACGTPDLEHCEPEIYQTYFAFLSTMLRTYLEKRDYELYESKLATWGLITDPYFRWCAHGCSAGFLNEADRKKIQCPECRKYQCFDCKKPWLDQHDDISCEEFEAWKKNNDPEFQQQGLAAHLKENGINCPKCKMRYELAKGGCMHFKCTQCHFEFCCGCNLAFRNYPACNLLPSCRGKGLHAHHPRDCFYYLRDEDCKDLQQLLQKHNVNYNQAANAGAVAENGEGPAQCQVKEQHETPHGLEDAICGKPLKDQFGLCENHYKEYLVGLINQHNIDPVDIFGVDTLQATLRRNEKNIPKQAANEVDAVYCTRLRQEVQRQLPLRPGNAQGVQGAAAAAAANQI